MSAAIFYKQQFLFQLLLGEGVFLFRLERKPCFRFVFAALLLPLFSVAFFLPSRYSGPIVSALQYLFMFLCTLLAICLCFQESFENLLFCGIAGYTIQHLAYLAFTVLDKYVYGDISAFGLPMQNPYSPAPMALGGFTALQAVIYLNIYVVEYIAVFYCIYAIAFEIFDPLICANHNLRLGRLNFVFLTGLLIMADVIFNMLTLSYTPERTMSHGIELTYNILLCLTILALIYNQLYRRALKDELAAVSYVLDQSK
ncbi:MAG: histidine kinase, partial [Blautia sp.]|nr:histidine kinase [Blautia sp.]